MLSKLFAMLEKHLSTAVVVGALVTLVTSCITGVATASVAYAQVGGSIQDVQVAATDAADKASRLEHKLSEHIDDERAARDRLRTEIRELRIDQFDANMNAYISCIAAKQRDPGLIYECRKPSPPKAD